MSDERPAKFNRVSVRDLRPPRAVDAVPTLGGKVGILVAKVEARLARQRDAQIRRLEDRLDAIELATRARRQAMRDAQRKADR
jgi:hypothetical protein